MHPGINQGSQVYNYVQWSTACLRTKAAVGGGRVNQCTGLFRWKSQSLLFAAEIFIVILFTWNSYYY